MSNFYDPRTTLSYNKFLNFVSTARGEGKTVGTLSFFINKHIKTGRKFVWIRRTQEDLKKLRPKMFTGLYEANLFPRGSFKAFGGTLYRRSVMGDNESDLEPMGYLADLNTGGSAQSISYEDCDYVCFDEMIPSNGRYLAKEVFLFAQLITTIVRLNPKIRVMCLMNSISNYSPYFRSFGIKNNGEEIITKKNILIHNSVSEAVRLKKKQHPWYQILDTTPFGAFINENIAMNENMDYVMTKKQRNKLPIWSLNTDEGWLTLYQITADCYLLAGEHNKACPQYNTLKNLSEGQTNIYKITVIRQRLAQLADKGILYFDSGDTKARGEEFLFG